jgi:hypothetical protein
VPVKLVRRPGSRLGSQSAFRHSFVSPRGIFNLLQDCFFYLIIVNQVLQDSFFSLPLALSVELILLNPVLYSVFTHTILSFSFLHHGIW